MQGLLIFSAIVSIFGHIFLRYQLHRHRDLRQDGTTAGDELQTFVDLGRFTAFLVEEGAEDRGADQWGKPLALGPELCDPGGYRVTAFVLVAIGLGEGNEEVIVLR